MTARKFGNVPGQVLDAHLVVDTYISPLEHSPMGLHAVGVRHAVDVLFGRIRMALFYHPRLKFTIIPILLKGLGLDLAKEYQAQPSQKQL